jgi:uncharacterized LabA/DUF88 family protein
MKIGFSNGALKNFDISDLEKIKIFKAAGANALEIPFREPESLFEFRLTKQLSDLLSEFDWLSIHAPFFNVTYENNDSTKKILSKLEELTKILPVKGIVFHPSNILDFDLLEKSGLPILIENMDLRKDSFKSIKDMEIIYKKYNFGFVLDVEHAFENDPTMNLAKDLIHLMGDRLKELHVSGARLKENIYENNHCLLNDSLYRKEILSVLKDLKHLPIILEVAFNENEKYKIKQELNFVIDALNENEINIEKKIFGCKVNGFDLIKNGKNLNSSADLDSHNPPGIASRDIGTLPLRKAIIFIDGNNFYHNCKKNFKPKKIDFNKITKKICYKFNLDLKEIRYYNSIPALSDISYDKHKKYLDSLKKDNIIICVRELAGRGEFKREKGVDILLASEMISKSIIKNECDVCILISGDADFLPAMQIIKDSKKEVIVSSIYKGFSKKFREGKFRYLILKDEEII